MTPIETLLDDLRDAIQEAEDLGFRFKFVNRIKSALEEYEYAPKQWMPPVPADVPRWAESFTVDENGRGTWWGCSIYEIYPGRSIWWEKNTRLVPRHESAGYFKIPPGTDWSTLKFRVRKDGVML